jgi:hypothetical protein
MSYLTTAEHLYKVLELLYHQSGFTWDAKVTGVEVSTDQTGSYLWYSTNV